MRQDLDQHHDPAKVQELSCSGLRDSQRTWLEIRWWGILRVFMQEK
jgi:hypothetical protein